MVYDDGDVKIEKKIRWISLPVVGKYGTVFVLSW